MKKIAYFLENNNHMRKLKEFCEKEEFGVLDLSCEEYVYDYDIIVLITDDYSKIAGLALKDIPVAIIGKCDKLEFFYEISEDFDFPQLRGLVDAIYHGGSIGYFSSSISPVEIHKVYKIFNDIFNIDKIVFNITRDAIFFCDTSIIQKIRIGLSEIITNAVEHGNLDISGDEKFDATENGTYLELVKKRTTYLEYKDRYVTVDVRMNKSGFFALVKDMGKGFDVNKETSQKSEDDLLKLHGRGILITKMYFDEIRYNEKGNEVTLIKRF